MSPGIVATWRWVAIVVSASLLVGCGPSPTEQYLQQSCEHFDQAVEAFRAGDIKNYRKSFGKAAGNLDPAFEESAGSSDEREAVEKYAAALERFSGPRWWDPAMEHAGAVDTLCEPYR